MAVGSGAEGKEEKRATDRTRMDTDAEKNLPAKYAKKTRRGIRKGNEMKILTAEQWGNIKRELEIAQNERARAARRELAPQPMVVVVKRENMENEEYVQCFNLDDGHPAWAGFMELLHRMEGAVVDDQELYPAQQVGNLKLLNEVRAQMVRNRNQARREK